MSTLNQDSPRASLVEQRSIDYIPSRATGDCSDQFTLWFGANLQVTAIVTGALAVVLGGDVILVVDRPAHRAGAGRHHHGAACGARAETGLAADDFKAGCSSASTAR